MKIFVSKKPPERQDGGRRGDDQGLRLRRKTLRCARVRTAKALTPRRFASSVLHQQKKPPGRQDGGRRGDDQGLRLRRKTRFASTNSRGAYAPPVRVFSSPPTKKPPGRRLFLLVEHSVANTNLILITNRRSAWLNDVLSFN